VQRVVHFTGGLVFGGAEQVLLTSLRGLRRDRWRSVLYYYRDAQVAPLLEGARSAGADTRAISNVPSESILNRIIRLARMLRLEKCVIFHAHLPLPEYCRIAVMAAALARIPVIIATAHLFQHAPSPRSLLYQRVLNIFVDRYIAVSHDLSRHLLHDLGIPPQKITVIHNGVPGTETGREGDIRFSALASNGVKQPIVLTCARLHEQKGLIHLLEAVTLVPEASLVIAGEGPQRAELEANACRLGLHERVLFLGHRNDVPALLAGCNIYVLPSLFEGLPLALLEAMHAGKPVIASAVGGVGEAITDSETGLLVPPARPDLLANAIRTLIANPLLAAQLGVAARARAIKEFSADVMVQRVMQVYAELCHDHNCSSGRDRSPTK
jgi:L-malate glycosyltransferase